MAPTRRLLLFIGFALTLWLVAACGTAPTAPASPPRPRPTFTAAPAATIAAETGVITGRVHLQSPPMPPMAIYAVDTETGAWFLTETEAVGGEAAFTLPVAPGTYRLFAFAGSGPFAAYSEDGRELSTVSVAAGQTVAEIIVRPPGRSECGAMFGVPAAPDGRFAVVAGPSEECRAEGSAIAPAEPEAAGMTNPPPPFVKRRGGRWRSSPKVAARWATASFWMAARARNGPFSTAPACPDLLRCAGRWPTAWPGVWLLRPR